MWHFVAGDDQGHPIGLPGLLDGTPDAPGHGSQMGRDCIIEIDPVLNLCYRDDQRVSGPDWVDAQESDTGLVAVNECSGNVPFDDSSEDRGHACERTADPGGTGPAAVTMVWPQ